MEAAQAMIEGHYTEAVRLRDRALFMEYSHEPKPSAPGAPAGRDWLCEMCKSVNFCRYVYLLWAAVGCIACA